jgi:aminomethyltransferase
MRTSPFHPRTSAACDSYSWKEWAGLAAVCTYQPHSEAEYFALRSTAGLLDISPLYKYDVVGPDAAIFLARIWTRDMSKIGVGRVVYSSMCDEAGKLLDDGTIARLGPEHFRCTSSEPWLAWFSQHSRGFDVEIRDTTDSICGLALQGPRARQILDIVTDFDMNRMRFFRVRKMTIAGCPVWVSRTGYTGDLGYEIFCENAHAIALWDAITAAGTDHGLIPIGLDALDVSRIEAGFVLQGVDYISAAHCVVEELKSTPDEAGLGWTVDLDRSPFIGQKAIKAERERGIKWDLVGLEISWPQLEELYSGYGLPPHLAPVACRASVPVYDAEGNQVGQVTSTTWSPTCKRYIALAQLLRPHHEIGTELQVEHTPQFERRTVTATVVEKPFFDPPRKRHTPGPQTPVEGQS